MVATVAPGAVPVSFATVAPPMAPRLRITPLAPQRYLLEGTIDGESVALLERAKGLLAHMMPGAGCSEILKRVLQDWVQAKERQKHGLTDRPRARTSEARGRYVPAQVKREVMKRDGGRCTFVAGNGRRCEAREHLEYDHVTPIARGGKTRADNLRLRCRTHNQWEADRVYGAGFMQGRRGEAPRHERSAGPRCPVDRVPRAATIPGSAGRPGPRT